MEERSQLSFALPRPGRALIIMLGLLLGVGIFMAVATRWAPQLFAFLVFKPQELGNGQLWRLLTAGIVTNPLQHSHLIFAMLGLYFLGPDVEKRWGGWRFTALVASAVIVGNLLAALANLLPVSDARFHPEMTFGPLAAITAIAVVWGRENAELQFRLFFFVPMKGKWLVWLTLGFLVLDIIFRGEFHMEGVVAGFGGFGIGLLTAGSPSPLRRAYLQIKLFFLRRRAHALRAEDLLREGPIRPGVKKPPRPGSPPLRVVQGGLEDVLRKRKPPKDKRFLN